MAQIRRARTDEAQLLSELALRSKAYWGYDQAFLERCRHELTVSADKIGRGLTFVLEAEGYICGFYALEPLSEQRMELNFLFVEPKAIGRGHGRALIQHAIACAAAHGFTTVEVVGDPNAREFYEAAGGRITSARPSASIPGRVLPVFEIDVNAGKEPASG